MSEVVYSPSLNFSQIKKRSISARSYRIKVPPSNGMNFTSDQVVQIDLDGNLAGTYYDFSSLYLKMKVVSANAYTLDRCGSFGFISRLAIQQSGASICDIAKWNVLATAMLDTDASSEYKAGYGAIQMGLQGDSLKGETVAAGVERVYTMPLPINPLFNTTPHKLLPGFSLAALSLRLSLESAATCAFSAVVPPAGFQFSEVEVCALVTELSPQAQSLVDQATGGQYNILATSFMNSGANLAAGATQLTQSLGFSMSSLERIVMIHRESAQINTAAAFSLGNRTTGTLTQFQYLINSQAYPQRAVEVGPQGAESTSEMLIADHSLVDFKKGSSLNNGVVAGVLAGLTVGALSGVQPETAKSGCFMLANSVGTSAGDSTAVGALRASNIGTYMTATDFENGLSVSASDKIYSGVSTIASNVQFVGTYTGAVNPVSIDFYACYTILLSLNMRGSGMYSVSI